MTVSTDWLERFGKAFGVDPVSLFDDPGQEHAQVVGVIRANGDVTAPTSQHRESISFDRTICVNPLFFWVAEAAGSLQEGAYIAAEKLEGRNIENAAGLDAIAALENGRLVFGRLIRGAEGRFTIVPPQPKSDIWYDQVLCWAGKPIASVQLL